ncbi:MAG: hypothetical protein LBR07_01375 [Puniceicoccales bacterium]|nr:hypothetical protein [Puniceicoccales bacterium]
MFAFQWFKDGVALEGATAPELEIAAVSAADAGDYAVVVTDNYKTSAVSATATLVVVVPEFASQPALPAGAGTSGALRAGEALTLAVALNNAAGVTRMQWWFKPAETVDDGDGGENGTGNSGGATEWVALAEDPAGGVTGTTSVALNIAHLVPADAGEYRLRVEFPGGVIESVAVRLAVTLDPLVITTQPPAALDAAEGAAVEIRLAARAHDTAFYQWLKDNAPVPGATRAALTLPAARLADAGRYTCIVADAYGQNVLSGACVLTVRPMAPRFDDTSAADATLTPAGGDALLTATLAAQDAAFTLQWQTRSAAAARTATTTGSGSSGGSSETEDALYDDGSGWVDIPGADTDTLALAGLRYSDNGRQYRCVATNTEGSTAGGITTLEGISPTAPALVWLARPDKAAAGTRATFRAYLTTAGDGPFEYVWRKTLTDSATGAAHTTIIAGANTLAYTTDILTDADDGAEFSLTVTGAQGLNYTARAWLRVYSPTHPLYPNLPAEADLDNDGLPDNDSAGAGNANASGASGGGTSGSGSGGVDDGSGTGTGSGSGGVGVATTAPALALPIEASAPDALLVLAPPTALEHAINAIRGKNTTGAAAPTFEVVAGAPVTYRVTATGGALAYQWRRNGTPIAGATDPTYETTTLADGDRISVLITNTKGRLEATAPTVGVVAPATIAIPPAPRSSLAATAGTGVQLWVKALGDGQLYYQWERATDPTTGAPLTGTAAANAAAVWQPIPNAVSPTYRATTPGLYRVTVTNRAGGTANTALALVE